MTTNWIFHPKSWDFSSTQMVFMSFSLFMEKKFLEKKLVFSGDGWSCRSSFSVMYLLAVPIKFPMNSQHVYLKFLMCSSTCSQYHLTLSHMLLPTTVLLEPTYLHRWPNVETYMFWCSKWIFLLFRSLQKFQNFMYGDGLGMQKNNFGT